MDYIISNYKATRYIPIIIGSVAVADYKATRYNRAAAGGGDNGKTHKYETYEKTRTGNFNPLKRYDGGLPNGKPGKPHINKKTGEAIPTPHIQGKTIPGGVRAAKSSEIPKT